uniref:Secreted protein n=1 Tax=Cacopsylla melanoneura TaxID=428564 RepID=A0A8D8XFA2_9HEMI
MVRYGLFVLLLLLVEPAARTGRSKRHTGHGVVAATSHGGRVDMMLAHGGTAAHQMAAGGGRRAQMMRVRERGAGLNDGIAGRGRRRRMRDLMLLYLHYGGIIRGHGLTLHHTDVLDVRATEQDEVVDLGLSGNGALCLPVFRTKGPHIGESYCTFCRVHSIQFAFVTNVSF